MMIVEMRDYLFLTAVPCSIMSVDDPSERRYASIFVVYFLLIVFSFLMGYLVEWRFSFFLEILC